MKKLLAIAALTTGLGGCGSMVQAQGECTARYSSYLQAWDCVREKVAANQAGAMNNDLGIRHMAFGDALAEKVRGGQITDVEAKYALSQELVRNNTAFEARKPQSTFCASNVVGSTLMTNCY